MFRLDINFASPAHAPAGSHDFTDRLGLRRHGIGISPGALAQEPPVEEQIVDAFQTLFGKHPGQRVNHAKGIVAEGSFKASPEAAGLTRAVHFQPGTVPVTVRFQRDRYSQPSRRQPERQPPRHGDQVPPARRQRYRYGDQQPAFLPGGHAGRVPRSAAGRRRQQAGQPEADATRRLRGEAPGGRGGGRDSQDAGKLRHRAIFRHQRVRLHQQGGRNPLHTLRRRTSCRSFPPRSAGRRQAGAGLPERRPESPAREGAGPVPPAGPGGGAR